MTIESDNRIRLVCPCSTDGRCAHPNNCHCGWETRANAYEILLKVAGDEVLLGNVSGLANQQHK